VAAQLTPRRTSWVLVAVGILLALALGGAAVVGLGIVKLPVSVDASPAQPSSVESVTPSSTPVPFRAAAWSVIASMSEARNGHTATLLADGKVLVAGGGTASAEMYDPSAGIWAATGKMIQTRGGHTATLLLDGRVLVTWGHSGDGGYPSSHRDRSAELYDPATGTWTATGATSLPHYGGTATLLLDGTVLLAGGYSTEGNSSGDENSAELYHPASGSWSDAGGMIETRVHHAATLLSDGNVLVVGGYGLRSFDQPDRLASAELFDPGTGTWTVASSMNEPRAWITALLLPDGRVLVAGGEVHITSAELYDPDSGAWTPTGNSDIRGTLGTYTLLGDGSVLAEGACCGGDTASRTQTAAELFNPVDGTWTATASMDETQFGHTATLLTDGTVLVAGGIVFDASDNETWLASAELYDPGSGT